jgi:lipopolysaccharide/colanic/teichoic acid biosynthesis glycosyltransferase
VAELLVSWALLVLSLPVMLLVAIAVRLDSSGPVLFRQVRVGERGRMFTMLKFRSMTSDAERDGQARWAAVRDPRVTRVGRVLRKYRLDELPQLWNVVRGEMALVGPRPERPELVADLVRQVPFYQPRHFVRPGITGWAQVYAPYASSVDETVDKLSYDLYYLKHSSLTTDLGVMLRTAGVMVGGRGAR